MLRTPAAYASTTCTAANEVALASCLTGLTSGQVTISLTADITLTGDLPRADLTTPAVDLTIDGNGYTIDGDGSYSAFDIDPQNNDDTLVMTDITIVDTFSSGNGSALYLDSPMDSATLERVVIEGAYSNRYGGAVYAKPDRLNIIDSVFRGNTSRDEYGGAVYAGDVFVSRSTFIGNSAGGMGGALYAADNAYVYDSYFVGNVSGEHGGAVVAYDGNMTVVDSEFMYNAATDYGGALYSEAPGTMNIVRSTFANNDAGYGGAIWFRRGGTTEITDSTFSGNSATDASGRGGAVYVPKNLSISGSTFTGNSAADGGAVAAVEGNPVALIVNNSTFDGNRSTSVNGEGGAIFVYDNGQAPQVSLAFTTFVENTTANGDDSGSTIWGHTDQSFLLTAVATVIDDTGTVPCWFNATGSVTVDDTFAFASGANATAGESCSFDGPGSDDTFVAGDFSIGSLQDNGGLTDTFLPALTSPLVLRAPSAADLGDDTVSTDQRSAARPSGSPSLFTIGAVQIPGDPAPGGSNAPVASAGNASAEVASPTTTVGGTPTSWVVRAYSIDDTYLILTDDTCAINSSAGTCTVTGLTNGQPYKFKATPSNSQGVGRASLASNEVTPQAPNPNPPAPVFPPSAPRDVTAVPGDRSVAVSWREPASSGSFPVSTYKATASPGGASCLTATLSCTVSGLTNGTSYTFTVQALNGAGWGPSGGPTAPVTPGGLTPAPAPVPLPAPLAPADSLLQTNGVVDTNVEVDPNTGDNGLVITGDGWSMNLDGLGPDGKPLNLTPEGALRLANERDVQTEGTGFLPNSDVDLYVDPPVEVTGAVTRVGARSTEAIYVGTVRTDARGNFTGIATLPEDIEPGDHVLQAVGYSPARQSRAMSLGVIVEPWIVLDQGTRKGDGRHDRIRTTGTSGGIDPGTRLTPFIRYSGKKTFSQGKATITVQSDGSFRWTREISKRRGLTAYVAWTDVESNRVFWAKVR